MFLGSIMPAMLMPGIMGTSTDNAITAEPMSRLLLYCAALGLQKISGAKNSQMPMNATAHCAHVLVRGASDSAPNSAMASPLTTSLIASALARHSIEGSPRSTVTKRAASPTLCVVMES